ncbi:PREDICTED: uncharacterized protein LOC108568445 [Nicrophorus vespilloides]|uniref:Uncharacterized protein LOC108568445 n=1 Tax=Nicrophorus vespilloides TaxID=110193 RepID=A0ABM1NDX6_NICVS|nr:PREDICTED: uncharacterized protein LOC108568445 [Nicrophorus vespilloides]
MNSFVVRLLLMLFIAAARASLDHYNVESYIGHLPDDLKEVVRGALNAELEGTDLKCNQSETVSCPPNKFRQPTGECNNIRHETWGSRGAAFLRLLPAKYSDGKSKPKLENLPSSEEVTRVFKANSDKKSHDSITALLGAWSELLLHDLASTGNLRSGNCCGQSPHPECLGKLNEKTCKEYMRSLPAIDKNLCAFEHRDQMNLASSFLDASSIYGNTDSSVERLRTYDAGLVNVSACAVCKSNALYSAILREHNRIAINLAQLNRHWPDENLFLESKRIVAAEIQHITYNEFLPTILDDNTIAESHLQLKYHGYYSDYSSSHKAGVYNEVALTALPILLSMIPSKLMNETATSFAEMVDVLISTQGQNPSFHMDVPLREDWDTSSLLIHMGRDHGLPGYVKLLEYCSNGTTTIKSFHDLDGIDKHHMKILKEMYNKVEDIDLLVGAILELPHPGAAVGPSVTCLLKEQFALLRRSDRFWYENDLPPSSLTGDQLKEIRKVTVAGILCANTDDLGAIQPKAFVQEDPFLNARLSCDQHPLPQLTAWLEMDHMTDLSEEMLMDAIAKAELEVLQRRKMEYEVWSTVGGVDPKSPTGTAASFSKANKQALKIANSSLLFEFASNEIINSLMNRRRKRQIFDNNVISAVFRDELSDGLQNVDVSSIIPTNVLDLVEPNCEETGPCDPSHPFRSFTGHCNNLRNPAYGKSLTTFSRLLPSSYEDGISRPRVTGVTGVTLPSPRIVSTVIHPDISNLHSRYTLMTMQYAQFLDHDLTMTPIHKGFHESIPNCRDCDSPRTVHPECNPFPVPPGDHYYPEVNITSGQRLCFPFMRSLPGQQHLGPREQVNQNTAYLDASQIYGENHCVARDLKGYGGRMNCTIHPQKGKDLLPRSDHHPECKAASGLCFIAGDGRASEQPALAVIHTIFMREHNRIVEALRHVNPHWDAEKLFEHARKIIIAMNQHVTYNEFLPRILSWNAVNLYGLKLLPQGYYKEYNPSCNPSIINEFAAAAFRIGHSMLRPHIPRLSPSYQIVDPPILLRDGFFKVDMIMQPGMVDEITRGLVSTPMETLDQFITGEVTNHLFEDRRIPFSGIDLVALNIQRARDHGIPSYNNYRALCNLKRAASFEDLAREIPTEVIARLKRIYPTVDDIDLFPGGMSERPLQGGLVGPTFACIIGIQFRQLRKCDRFWYENQDPVVKFTEAQLQEIRKITLSKILCENLDHHSDMQRAAFDIPSNFLNPRVSCQSLPGIDFNAWRESSGRGCLIGDSQVQVGESAFPSPCTSCVCTSEGGQCASLRVTDCSQLLREWSRETVLRDDVCTAQCGFLLRDTTPNLFGRPSTINQELLPPPHRNTRSRPLGPTRFNSNFNDFKFPDLTPFIAK